MKSALQHQVKNTTQGGAIAAALPPKIAHRQTLGLAAPVNFLESRFRYDFSRLPVSALPVAEEDRLVSLTSPVRVQAKLVVNRPGDIYEQEADRIAEAATREDPHPLGRRKSIRFEEDGEELLKTEVPGQGPISGLQPDAMTGVREVLRSPGQPLDLATRAFFEPRFERNLCQVRIHTDPGASASAWRINALAYTVGKDVVFGASQYRPSTRSGRKLIAHELAHVVQQQGSSPCVQMQEEEPPPQRSERVWGYPITRSMCRCRRPVEQQRAWCGIAIAVYMGCDNPDNPTWGDVRNCFFRILPMALPTHVTPVGGTSHEIGPAPVDPCGRIIDHGIHVHEYFHRRRDDRLARGQGDAFWQEWQRIGYRDDRLDLMRPRFPAEVAAYEAVMETAHDFALSEIEASYKESMFLGAVLDALDRICP